MYGWYNVYYLHDHDYDGGIMERWSVATNDLYKYAVVHKEEASWLNFFIEDAVMTICHWFPPIPLPKWKVTIDGEETTYRDWYGTTRDLFHIWICEPTFQLMHKRRKLSFSKELDLDEVTELLWYSDEEDDDPPTIIEGLEEIRKLQAELREKRSKLKEKIIRDKTGKSEGDSGEGS